MGANQIVIIDADLEEIVPGFLEKRRHEIPLLLESLQNKDFLSLKSMGHKLKGNAGGYGFDELSKLGADLEEAASNEQTLQCKSIIESINNYISNIEVQFKVMS